MAMFDQAASWVATPGNVALGRTGWASIVLKEFAKVAMELPRVGGQTASAVSPPREEHGYPCDAPQNATAPPSP